MNDQPILVWYSRHYPSRAMMQDVRGYRLLMFQPPRPHYPEPIWRGIKALCESETEGRITAPAAVMVVNTHQWRDEFVELLWTESRSTDVIRAVMQPDRPLRWSGEWKLYFWNPRLQRVCWDTWKPKPVSS